MPRPDGGLTDNESALRGSPGALSHFMKEVSDLTSVKAVALNEKVPFHCRLCGDCCRHVKGSIMLEPMDVYRLARYLRERGEPVIGTEDVLARYAHPAWLADNFPLFLLNTVGTFDICTFLEENRCAVYEARPRVCRLYPFSVAPGERGRDFQYFLCTEKPHHFADGIVRVKDWLSQNFTREDKDVLKADYEAVPVLGRKLRAMGEKEFQSLLFQFLYYRYYNYDLDRPFLPQFHSNLEQLKKLTGGGNA